MVLMKILHHQVMQNLKEISVALNEQVYPGLKVTITSDHDTKVRSLQSPRVYYFRDFPLYYHPNYLIGVRSLCQTFCRFYLRKTP